ITCDTSNWAPALFDVLLPLEEAGVEAIDWDAVSRHAHGVWTREFYTQHQDKLSRYGLSSNANFPADLFFDEFAAALQPYEWQGWLRHPQLTIDLAFVERHRASLQDVELSKHVVLSVEVLDALVDLLDTD